MSNPTRVAALLANMKRRANAGALQLADLELLTDARNKDETVAGIHDEIKRHLRAVAMDADEAQGTLDVEADQARGFLVPAEGADPDPDALPGYVNEAADTACREADAVDDHLDTLRAVLCELKLANDAPPGVFKGSRHRARVIDQHVSRALELLRCLHIDTQDIRTSVCDLTSKEFRPSVDVRHSPDVYANARKGAGR